MIAHPSAHSGTRTERRTREPSAGTSSRRTVAPDWLAEVTKARVSSSPPPPAVTTWPVGPRWVRTSGTVSPAAVTLRRSPCTCNGAMSVSIEATASEAAAAGVPS